MLKIFSREGVSVKILYRLSWYMIFGTFIGARLGHCLFYEPQYYFENPLEIFQTWRGGFASHGAGLGIFIALYIFSRVERLSYLWTLDRLAIVVALSGFFIRMGNLFNSEIYGNPTNIFWGFEFVRSPQWYKAPINSLPCHPAQIYEALAYLAIFASLYLLYFNKNEKPKRGVIVGLFLTTVFTVRFFIEFLKLEQVYFEKGMALNMGQLLSIPFIICGICLLVRAKLKKDENMEKKLN